MATFSACLRSVIVYNEEVAAKNYCLNCETQARINHMANQSRAGPHSNLHTSDVPQDADTAAIVKIRRCVMGGI